MLLSFREPYTSNLVCWESVKCIEAFHEYTDFLVDCIDNDELVCVAVKPYFLVACKMYMSQILCTITTAQRTLQISQQRTKF